MKAQTTLKFSDFNTIEKISVSHDATSLIQIICKLYELHELIY